MQRTGVVYIDSTKLSLSSEAARAKNTFISDAHAGVNKKHLNVLGMPFFWDFWAIQTADSYSIQTSCCQGETYAEDAEGGKDGWIVGPGPQGLHRASIFPAAKLVCSIVNPPTDTEFPASFAFMTLFVPT